MKHLIRKELTLFLLLFSFLCCSKEQVNYFKLYQNIQFNDLYEKIDEIVLKTNNSYDLSSFPRISSVNKKGEFIILDNFFKRQILVFDKKGEPVAKIGREGKEKGEYIYPECLYYNEQLDKYYVYDGDLHKIIIYDHNYSFEHEFWVHLFCEGLAVTNEERIYCYSSGAVTTRGPDKVIYECTRDGKIVNKFYKMSKFYNPAIESKGGGVIIINNCLYVITPYEYLIHKYNLDGKIIKRAGRKSRYYFPPKKLAKDELNKLKYNHTKRKDLHDSFSHIIYILEIGNDAIGVIFGSNIKGERLAFLDLYDLDLNMIAADIRFPFGTNSSLQLYAKKEYLYRIEAPISEDKAQFITVFRLKRNIETIMKKYLRE